VDELFSAHAAGENAGHFSGVRIEMGQRLSGWVAAHRQTIVNSDPMLDLGEVARALRPPLRSCLSTPLLVQQNLVGVLTVYSTHRDAFSEDHRRIVEVVARQVSETVQNAVDFRRDQNEKLRDQLTGLPNRHHLERFIVSELATASIRPCSILLIEIVHPAEAPTSNVRSSMISQVLAVVRAALRGADLLFKDEGDRFIALLPQTDSLTADSVGRHMALDLSDGRLTDSLLRNSAAIQFGRATAPNDGSTLTELLKSAEAKLSKVSAPRPSIH